MSTPYFSELKWICCGATYINLSLICQIINTHTHTHTIHLNIKIIYTHILPLYEMKLWTLCMFDTVNLMVSLCCYHTHTHRNGIRIFFRVDLQPQWLCTFILAKYSLAHLNNFEENGNCDYTAHTNIVHPFFFEMQKATGMADAVVAVVVDTTVIILLSYFSVCDELAYATHS